jgi:hypothetical protein
VRALAIVLATCLGLAGVLAVGSCLLDRKTNELSCSTTEDCAEGRTCTSGFCIPSDAPIVPPCAENCTDLGGVCDGETCRFSCDPITCPGIVTCPAGLPCAIACNGVGACGTGIACTSAESCTITCSDGACQAAIDCGTSDCDVTCNGDGCGGEIRCGQADSCTVACNGPDSCSSQIQCGNGSCDVTCAGSTSCAGGTACGSSCRCDVGCTGVGSCGIAATCTKMQCEDPPGCDSSQNGCGPTC